jgi:hypothetical protein
LASAAISAALFVPRTFSANPAGSPISEANPRVSWTGPFKTPTGSADCHTRREPGLSNLHKRLHQRKEQTS